MAACALLLGAGAAKPSTQTPVLVQTPPRVVVVMDPQIDRTAGVSRRLAPDDAVGTGESTAGPGEGRSRAVQHHPPRHAASERARCRDLARAQALLEPLLTATGKDAQLLAPLVQLLSGQYAELRRQDESIDKLNAQLRDARAAATTCSMKNSRR